MYNFDKVHFHGEFRDYQSRVLKKSDVYLTDGKINIVAAPGSGKTVLGLELIRRIGKPCLIFSPTTAIREQWGERFADLFLDDKNDFESLFSTDLHSIKLVNSITYQALFTAMEKIDTTDDGDDSFCDIDIVQEIKDHNIGTICLDEAHHLKNEWQRSLEKLISIVGKDVKIVALTATPPYDSEANEWNRYLEMCGEVDEEIFVPELVARDTLCPHQDYIYFNYPTEEETSKLQEYRQNAQSAIEEVSQLDFVKEICNSLNTTDDLDKIFSSAKEYIALLIFFKHYGFEVNKKLIRTLVGKRGLPLYKTEFTETAFRFLLSSDITTDEQKDILIAIFKKYAVYSKRKVELVLNERLKRALVSSVGKLESIAKIAESEYSAMGDKLRMLILTDHIKKEALSQITREEEFSDINIVSIFETLRRMDTAVNIGVLSGSLVILPNDLELEDVKHTRSPIEGTKYSVVEFAGSTHTVVKLVGELFANGNIQILIGTKSLLGEGWDAPCINSLIMASFIGSYVLSNQMRGRAIRIDKNDPNKTSNIWHLVTVEPDYLFGKNIIVNVQRYVNKDDNVLLSYDFDILKRRFDAFMGPAYESDTIESGIERISAVKPPYTKEGIKNINNNMLTRSQNRELMRQKWAGQVKNCDFAVNIESEIDKEKRVPTFTWINFALAATLIMVESAFVRAFINAIVRNTGSLDFWQTILFIALSVGMCFLIAKITVKTVLHFNPARSVKTLGIAVYRTLVECGLIASSAKVETESNKQLKYVRLYLRNASIHDQNVFNTAMAELLSPIENPRYILIKKQIVFKYNYRLSFACPSIIGRKKEYVEVLAQKLKNSTGKFEPVYTRNENGRAFILKCRKHSYITQNQKLDPINGKKYKVSRSN